MDLNIFCIIGKLTEDVKLSATKNGKTICSMTVAVERATEGENDNLEVQYFGKNADSLSPYLKKSAQVAIKGRIRVDSWTYNGKTYSKIVLIAEDVEILGFKKDDSGEPLEGPEAQSYDGLNGPETFNDDDIPF